MGGEDIADRMILAALTDAVEGKPQRARDEAVAAVKHALKNDQRSMLMKARLTLGEVEMESGRRAAGRQLLVSLISDADQKGFGLISQKARELLERQPSDSSRKAVKILIDFRRVGRD